MAREARLDRIRAEFEARGLIGGSVGGLETDLGARLTEGLAVAGPLFALFGRYLAGRPDRLKLNDCLELARVPISISPTPIAQVAETVRSSLGAAPADIFRVFHPPRRTTLLHQWHDAGLEDGTAVQVKLVRPEARSTIDSGLEVLPVLEELTLDGNDVTSMVEEFIVWLDRQLDLEREVAALEELASEVETFDAIEIPTIHRDLCRREVAVTARVDGTALDALLDGSNDHRPKLARRLCQAWLQQSLLEGACPEGPLVANLRAISSTRFALTGGLVTSLDPRWRRNILDAVVATARTDPDRACEAILDECTATGAAVDRNEVLTEIRQAESFRSGGWTDEFAGRRLADMLFVYWRLVRRSGHRPKPHTVSFIRGFSELEFVARQLAPDSDPMAEAVEDLRLVAAAVSLRESLGPTALLRAAERATPVIAALLENPDRFARRFRDRSPERTTDHRRRRRRSRWWVAAGALAVSAAAAIVGVTALRAHPDLPWLEPTVTVGFVALMALVFWFVGRPASR